MIDSSPISDGPRSYTARLVFTGNSPPLERGVVEIADGVITAVHNRPDPNARDLGNAAIIPGLVNAHTHLEFSDLAEPIEPATPFTDWIRNVVATRRQRTAAVADVVKSGLAESAQGGTTLVGDIATDDDAGARNRSDGPDVVVFREILGFAPEQVAAQNEIAAAFLAPFADVDEGESDVHPGLSPHAPYSVHPDLFRDVIQLAAENRVPVAMHLAETREELELLDRGTGSFVEMLKQFGVWREAVIPKGVRPMAYLWELAKADRSLVIHGNYLADDELQFLASRENLSLVFCPRTHAYFNHSPHPWRRLLELGGNVAIGTDSRASNPDLSLWRELRFLKRRHPDLADELLLQLGTVNGARALGFGDSVGFVAPGRRADFAVVKLNDPTSPFAESNTVTGCVMRGRSVE